MQSRGDSCYGWGFDVTGQLPGRTSEGRLTGHWNARQHAGVHHRLLRHGLTFHCQGSTLPNNGWSPRFCMLSASRANGVRDGA
jgi:hypothetical protein